MNSLQKRIVILALLGDPTLPAGIPGTGGFNETLRELLKVISGFGLPVTVITDTTEYCTEKYTQLSEHTDLYRVFISDDEHHDQERLRYCQSRVIGEISSLIKAIGTIAVIHSFYWFSGHIAKCIYERYHIPYIHTPVSLAYNKLSVGEKANCLFQVECERDFLNKADKILAITSQEANILSSYYNISDKKIIITGRSVDEIFHHPVQDENGFPAGMSKCIELKNDIDAQFWSTGAFTYLGRMVPIKGIANIIQAWERLFKKYGAKTPPLWLAGGTTDQIASIRQLVMKEVYQLPEYENQSKIIWWGYLNQAAISTIFLKTLVLIAHSKFEAGGRVVLEAMCQGKPVIATPYGFAADYIVNQVNGFLVPYGNVDLLARRMECFIRNPLLSRSMGRSAKYIFNEIEHCWNYGGTHEAIYKNYLLGGSKRNSLTRSACPQLQIDEETRDKIDCFPYYDATFYTSQWIGLISSHFSAPINKLTQVKSADGHARHYSFVVGTTQFRIKQFYTRINYDSIWDKSELKQVYTNLEQIRKAIYSQNFCGITPIYFSSEAGFYYIVPEYNTVIPNYTDITLLLSKLGCSDALDELKEKETTIATLWAGTLRSAFNRLVTSTREYGYGPAMRALNHTETLSDLIDLSESDALFGINYGKQLKNHIVVHNGELLLLPSTNWYWGELGPDYISATILTGSELQPLPGQSNNVRQLLWMLCISWRQILRDEWRGLPPNPICVNRFESSLSLLSTIDKNFIF